MTRFTIGVKADDLTFRPVTSSLIRKSKDGDVNIVMLLFGSHYNVPVDGILQQDKNEGVKLDNANIHAENGLLEVSAEKIQDSEIIAELQGVYSSFMYFYPGTKVKGHLSLSETSNNSGAPELIGSYRLIDLLSKDEIRFSLSREINNCKFEFIEIVDGVKTILYDKDLEPNVDEVYFEFDYLDKGRSKFYTYDNYTDTNTSKTRRWIGDIRAKVSECNAGIYLRNDEEKLHTVSSDFFFIEYKNLFLKFDRTFEDRFVGDIKMFDTVFDKIEDNWLRILSRDYKFIGDRVIENGMVRIVILTENPKIEIWGWNYYNITPSWEKCMEILVDSDTDDKSLKVQNVVFEYFNHAQIKAKFNFGTSTYQIIMSRGDPYITVLGLIKKKLKFRTGMNRLCMDIQDGPYSRIQTFNEGHPSVRGVNVEVVNPTNTTGAFVKNAFTESAFTQGVGKIFDNWIACYNNDTYDGVVGWISNVFKPNSIDIVDEGENTLVTMNYENKGNIFGIGVLPSFPTNLVNGIPKPFVVGKQDEYVKWRANEAPWAYKELEAFKRR